ncbi:unnamed protein product (macronuclear) [Paramecium tetraurelia]|uniref:Uncharacterized protein n=1 Tax=Paramecium tetraurelia TaxID=5888 RepID=A0C6S7_PARTE|nr:uncharacterized protein GSPATT00035623001 [Paramecium tetraurelia]CAK66494.1 unnamed protein product [Paramecium tetraurelia]|eukprot:XP_001433891.1 hypothetical protein (macronuclear) [Paramecium tetraurelia strain d4-2]
MKQNLQTLNYTTFMHLYQERNLVTHGGRDDLADCGMKAWNHRGYIDVERRNYRQSDQF